MNCINCNHEVLSKWKFCPECGTKLSEPAKEKPAKSIKSIFNMKPGDIL